MVGREARAGRRGRLGAVIAVSVGGLALALMAAHLFHQGRGTTFFFDEWNVILDRRTGVVGALLEPHNGHLSVVPFTIYRAMFAVFGIDSYVPYRIMGIAGHLLCVILLFVAVRPRLGTLGAGVTAAFLLVLGRAWQDLLWPFQIGYFLSIAGGLVALIAVSRQTRGSNVAVAGALLLSLGSSGLGVPFLAAVAVHVAVERRWREWWMLAVPAGGYAVWYLAYGGSESTIANLGLAPRFVLNAAAAATGAVAGIGMAGGRVLLVVLGIASLAVVVWRRVVPPRLAAAVAGGAAFWGLTALSRGAIESPDASRYLYPGAVFVLLALTEVVALLRARRPTRAPGPTRAPAPTRVLVAAVAAAAALAVAVPLNLRELDRGAQGLRETSQFVRAELAAVEMMGAAAPPGLRPDESRMPQVTAGRYLDAIDQLGSPADRAADPATMRPPLRHAVDSVFVKAATVAVVASARCPLAPTTSASHEVRDGHDLFVTGRTVAAVHLRRFGPAPIPVGVPAAALSAGRTVTVRLPETGTERSWRVSIVGEGAACAAAPNGR